MDARDVSMKKEIALSANKIETGRAGMALPSAGLSVTNAGESLD